MMEVTLEQQIKCVTREIGMRKRVYPRWVSTGRMKKEEMEREIAAMEAVLATLKKSADNQGKLEL